MDKESQEIIEKKILKEIERTSTNILEYKKMAQPIAPDDAIGRVSRMDAINNKSVLDAALIKAEIKLKKLKIVQKEINKNGFGQCLKCKKQIPIERLIIIPESKKCVNCA
tara:strand:+ start:532 stop:861 length:330 start_codon:yes stop_codon:yes gene_type:complete